MSVKGAAKERTDSRLKEPKQYNVIMINDDFTTMEFVVEILVEVFHKDVTKTTNYISIVNLIQIMTKDKKSIYFV